MYSIGGKTRTRFNIKIILTNVLFCLIYFRCPFICLNISLSHLAPNKRLYFFFITHRPQLKNVLKNGFKSNKGCVIFYFYFANIVSHIFFSTKLIFHKKVSLMVLMLFLCCYIVNSHFLWLVHHYNEYKITGVSSLEPNPQPFPILSWW